MLVFKRQAWLAWLAVGLIVGLVIGGLWLETPLHAVATDRYEGFIMATGWVDEGVEAVYFLDSLTGALRAKVVSNQTQNFQAHYEANVARDFAVAVESLNVRIRQANSAARAGAPPQPEIQIPETPNYMMVTGVTDLRRGGAARARPASAMVYVAETNSGIVLAYVIPWDQHKHNGNMMEAGTLVYWAGDLFTTPLVQTP
jgi:hypothetical protein